MKHYLPLLALSLSFHFPASVEARDTKVLSARAQAQYRAVARDIYKQRNIRSSRPVYRVLSNSAVYRYEGNPTRRHEEVSSPEIIFHVDKSHGRKRIVSGHAWDR